MESLIIVTIYSYILGSIPFGLIFSKILGFGDIRKIGSGNIGATNALRTGSKKLALELVHNGSCDLNTIINNLTSNPAKILGIRNGTLSVGSEADIAVFDLDKPWVFKKENIKSKSKNTAIEDRKLQGKVEKTFINGDLVFSE